MLCDIMKLSVASSPAPPNIVMQEMPLHRNSDTIKSFNLQFHRICLSGFLGGVAGKGRWGY